MKRITIISISLFLLTANSMAQVNTYVNPSVSELGTIAGAAYACNAGQSLKDFEFIASQIMVNTANDRKMENVFIQEYVMAKKNAMERQAKRPPVPCSEFLREFEKQPIFQFTVYSDGSIKTDKGQWILPRGQKSPPKGVQ